MQTDDTASDVPLHEHGGGHGAPYHLINTVANFPSSANVAMHERQGDFFLMSQHYCGSPLTGYSETENWYLSGRRGLDLATAIATSGAAVAPHMALLSVRPARMLMSFLNLRLGLWIGRPKDHQPGDAPTPSKRRFPQRVMRMRPGPWQLLMEMLGWHMDEKSNWLMLTDGAHLENSGIYELLRRRCRYIVAIDGSADADARFGSMMTLVRHAAIDLGVKIDAKFDELRPDAETGLTPAHGALCRITYPKDEGVGLLLVVKLSLTGDESELIKAYQAANPAFPNQSTADQSFDEHQFEAYRQLGVHAVESLLKAPLLAAASEAETPDTVADWLGRLSQTIPPPRRSRRDT